MIKNKMFDLTGRVVVVSGASSGLGVQMAKGFALHGADLIITARRLEKLEDVAKEIREYGVKCLAIQCDVTKTESVNQAAEKAEKEFGKVDVLVNCAGSAKNAGVLNMTDEEWNFTIDTDLTSVFLVTRAFANIMKKNNYGRIINIASMYGLVGNTAIDTVAYHASKGGVVNFTRAVAAELAKYNITCNAICPGYFATELTIDTLKTEAFTSFMKGTVPLGRYGNEGELNAGAIFLASDEASYVTGIILPIDGGYTCI
jgi:gluconate 5-dehydrogenase